MPLITGKSPASFSKNVETEMHHDKPLKQSLAIAYAMKKKAMKDHKAKGGMCMAHGAYACHMCHGGMEAGGDVAFNHEEQESGYMPHKYAEGGQTGEALQRMNMRGVARPAQGQETSGHSVAGDLARQGRTDLTKKIINNNRMEIRDLAKKNRTNLAEGGEVRQHYEADDDPESGFEGEEKATGYLTMPEEEPHPNAHAIPEDDRMLNQHGAQETGAEGMDEDNEPQHMRRVSHDIHENDDHPFGEGGLDDDDMVGRVMKQREMHYSEGGRVANHTRETTGREMNQFDDLVKRDDLEQHYTGANSGDYDDDEQENEDRRDIVARAMKSRRLKDRNPGGYGHNDSFVRKG